MIPASRAASRVALAGCLAALALALCACGGDATSADSSGEAPVEVTAKPTAGTLANERDRLGSRCGKQLDGFVETLETLRERLVDGLSYERYVEEIDSVRARYDKIPAAKLTLACLSGAATPAEKAFGKYLEAANAWGACIDESGCEAATVEPQLQKQWKGASHFLDRARSGLSV